MRRVTPEFCVEPVAASSHDADEDLKIGEAFATGSPADRDGDSFCRAGLRSVEEIRRERRQARGNGVENSETELAS